MSRNTLIFKSIPQDKFCDGFVITNAIVSPVGRVKEGDLVTVTCSKSYRYVLIGDKEVTCGSTGEWSLKPECRRCGMSYLFLSQL